ncbi:MAG: excinuclease ABC subunit UvrB [Candidatus Pacebacteria bacterium]|nr:excinuclease ABC subunit UvrB [Candidatus Paceibacterota bacterium]
MSFSISKKLVPAGDQPGAIKKLVSGFKKGSRFQTLMGVTGSGKTFTMAHVINQLNRPTLVISHNKTLAAQLYEELKTLFPNDHVHYFVSYYDYYQPEAYLPNSDTYIEKEVQINEEIDQLRHAAVQSVLTNRNTIVVASVSCIYNLGSPEAYRKLALRLARGQEIEKRILLKKLLALQFERNELGFWRGNFRQRADYIDIWPPAADTIIRVKIEGGVITELVTMQAPYGTSTSIQEVSLFPAKFWSSEEEKREVALSNIRLDLQHQIENLKDHKRFIEAERLKRRTEYDMTLIKEVGWCKGVENYSRYLEGREEKTPPFTLIDYFSQSTQPKKFKDFLVIIDESHMTIPQIRGMYQGDKARKETLIQHGFRLPSALDNRPLMFDEFLGKIDQTLFVSATPSPWEIKKSEHTVEQIVRPTYLVDPIIEVRPEEHQIIDMLKEVSARVAKGERVLITVLTKRLSEALAKHLKEKNVKAAFLHSEIDTLERPKILLDLRNGVYDVLVGINLLREGLDLPEVSLIVIFDADKESFLRDKTSFIQIIGRASRNINGKVIMYAHHMTHSMKEAIHETNRRREIQEAYNKKHRTQPITITKERKLSLPIGSKKELEFVEGSEFKRDYIKELKQKLELAQRNLQFEKATYLQRRIDEIQAPKHKNTSRLRRKRE